ncbi:Gfo/Idh/MocA family protein, partial [Streptomyces sp. L7]
LRWHPAIRKVVDLVRAGEIGQVRHIGMRWTFHRTSTEDWRSNPEVSRWWSLSGVGAHCIDLMWLFASELGLTRASFTASTLRGVLGGGNEETTAITATFEEGVSALILSSVLFPAPSELVIFGEDGHLSAVGVLGRANIGELTLNGRPVPYVFHNPYVRQLEGFCDTVLSGSSYPVSGEVGLKVLADLDSIM